MSYIEVIKDIIFENNLSQERLAKIIGVNQTTVSQWLLGKKKPSFDNIVSICENFQITPNEFFGYDKN
ncbi:MAG: helix-turn-helix transcriptional regulator [Clostridia bacterium]|nr:helix-turn-helix transcriptional regulator [Clostridia bacterium]